MSDDELAAIVEREGQALGELRAEIAGLRRDLDELSAARSEWFTPKTIGAALCLVAAILTSHVTLRSDLAHHNSRDWHSWMDGTRVAIAEIRTEIRHLASSQDRMENVISQLKKNLVP